MATDPTTSSGEPNKPPRVRLAEGQEVGLGCGTLILIALIVIIFSGTDTLELEVRGLQSEVDELRKAIEIQSEEIRQLRQRLAPPEADADNVMELQQ